MITRRNVLTATGCSAMTLALRALMADESAPAMPVQAPHRPPRARSVISLFMSGGPSQVDTFDPKPDLAALAGKDVPESIAKTVPKIKRAGLKNLMASPWAFHRHGQSGLPISELFPNIAKHADDLCVIRSMTHRNPIHGPGECVALTGDATGHRPSLGAWSLYGLGTANRQLPAYITMNLHTDGMQHPQAAGWSSGFLPARFQGTVVDPNQGIQNIEMPEGVGNERRQQELSVIRKLNRRFMDSIGQHSELEARIRSYETAFLMQTSAPELFDIDSETMETMQLYGLGDDASSTVGRGCLLARRMVERGVRFVQIRVGGWDAHGNIAGNHKRMAKRTDQPIGGLLQDLKRRGLLDSTLVVWGGEFGRTPTMEGRGKGRDHSPAAYSVWLAGGGVTGGQIIGETDPIGYVVTQRPVKPTDLHATILSATGLDSDRLIFDHHGLKETPLGVTGGGVVHEVFS
ncbi:hypothetical protein Mal52_31830 [Symmachiella dynata]|uniref:DUF1501 domain-containing protein n=1 Tax=Symmachiella dynata TaxID=2527995 RepID=A0A517ZQF6_9PLAN|nr:DUF1501 domain-containing protein [Symmachiella dynata]QDU44697.1 hypothetical protein Mal52_31830 [Symmachiella dynata]